MKQRGDPVFQCFGASVFQCFRLRADRLACVSDGHPLRASRWTAIPERGHLLSGSLSGSIRKGGSASKHRTQNAQHRTSNDGGRASWASRWMLGVRCSLFDVRGGCPVRPRYRYRPRRRWNAPDRPPASAPRVDAPNRSSFTESVSPSMTSSTFKRPEKLHSTSPASPVQGLAVQEDPMFRFRGSAGGMRSPASAEAHPRSQVRGGAPCKRARRDASLGE